MVSFGYVIWFFIFNYLLKYNPTNSITWNKQALRIPRNSITPNKWACGNSNGHDKLSRPRSIKENCSRRSLLVMGHMFYKRSSLLIFNSSTCEDHQSPEKYQAHVWCSHQKEMRQAIYFGLSIGVGLPQMTQKQTRAQRVGLKRSPKQYESNVAQTSLVQSSFSWEGSNERVWPFTWMGLAIDWLGLVLGQVFLLV